MTREWMQPKVGIDKSSTVCATIIHTAYKCGRTDLVFYYRAYF